MSAIRICCFEVHLASRCSITQLFYINHHKEGPCTHLGRPDLCWYGTECTYVYSKTVVELVQAPGHASEMGYQLLIPLCCNQWGRQGEVLSPYLFAVYLHELSIQLSSARVGCIVGNMVVNHLMFGDEICVFSPSISGLQCLLNVCGDYAAEHEITCNCNKTIGILFSWKSINNLAHQMFF